MTHDPGGGRPLLMFMKPNLFVVAACLAVVFGTSYPPQDDPKIVREPCRYDLLGLQLFLTFLQKSSYFSFEIAWKNVIITSTRGTDVGSKYQPVIIREWVKVKIQLTA